MKQIGITVAALLATAFGAGAQGTLYVDAGSKGHDINPGMYGIFFEEINHSGDGGLYAELLQNRGFEEQVLPGGFHQMGTNRIQTENITEYLDLGKRQLTWDWNFADKKMRGWKVDSKNCTLTHDVLTPAKPLHENTPNAMNLKITGAKDNAVARLINTGYWGIYLEQGGKYDLRFYLNTSDYQGKVKAVIYDAGCTKVIAEQEFDVDNSGEWKEYKSVMTSPETLNDANFALVFSGNGTIDVDYVSLFPQDTFNGRPNGMRKDIAQILADLKPKFMRWPGGCIVEGITLDNRVKWKETLGDPMTRRGEYDLWGYRSTWGMGYHEILQFCEDTGMDCMFVGNAGLACIGSLGEYVSGAEAVEPYYQDIKDAIEYAIGDPATNEWAKRRADAGHPAPFPLKYVEIGNENFSKRYDDNFQYIYKKLKAEYPQLTFLNTMGIDHAEEFKLRLGDDMIDPHWYVTPEYFYNSRTIFDNTPRGHYNIYVGEYATNAQVGDGNLEATLSEASFMIDMERNSDIVKMASYAPLIQNSNAVNWRCNLIWQRSGESFGRASYYNQKMFSENVPSYNIKGEMHSDRSGVPYNGRAGIGTWLTAGKFRNFKVSDHSGNVLYTADFVNNRDEWTDMEGTWSVGADGLMAQTASSKTRCISLMNTLAFRDGVIEVEAYKNSGGEGFLLVFGCDDNDWNHYYQLNVGGWNNTGIAIEDVNNGGGAIISERPSFKVENGRWYKLKVVCKNGKVEAYVDDKLYCSHDFGKQTIGRINTHTGYDAENGEIVVKVVNAESEPLPLTLALNAKNIASTASVETLTSESLWDENSFDLPTLIAPVKKTVSGVTDKFSYSFEPYSFTIVRIKAQPADAAMEIPAQSYSCEPRALTATVGEKGKAADLKAMIAEAGIVMLDDVPGYDALRAATQSAQADLKSGDADKIAAAIAPMKKALDTYYKEQMVVANEVTDKIQNPDFQKDGDGSGWMGNIVVRANVAEMYNTRFAVYQTVEGLEDGWYLVYAQAYYRNGTHPDARDRNNKGTEELLAKFSLNEMTKPVVSVMSEVHSGYWYDAPNSMEDAQKVFKASPDHYANYLMAYVSDGKLKIAFTKDGLVDSDWFLFGNVRMFRVPSSNAGVISVEESYQTYSPDAVIYDIQGRRVGNYAGLNRLSPGAYIITENGRSSKILR
ncbi:MAG: DUF1080 domain-containing protein [Muribaculaceae bacterium]|nr:DUF1080 domain-containing protein [Muribaculaceae bacterium]